MSNKGLGMSILDFKLAMRYVYRELNPVQNASPSPSLGATPISPMNSGISFAPSMQERQGYEKHFAGLARGNPIITGDVARGFFMQSGLDTKELKQIWDIVSEGHFELNQDQFCAAMHLIRLKVKHRDMPIPDKCPPELKSSASSSSSSPMMGNDPLADNRRTSMNFSQSPMMGIPPTGMTPMAPTSGQFRPITPTGPTPIMINNLPADNLQHQTFIKNAKTLHDSVQHLLQETKAISTDTFMTQNQLSDKKERMEQLRKEEEELKQKLAQTKIDLERAKSEKNSLDTEMSSYFGKVEVLKRDKELYENELSQLKSELDRLNEVKQKGGSSTQGLEQNVDELQNEVIYYAQELTKVRDEIVSFRYKQEEGGSRREQLEQQANQLREELNANREALRQVRQEVDSLQSQLVSLEAQKQEFSKASSAADAELTGVRQKQSELTQKLEAARADVAAREKQYAGSAVGKVKSQRLKATLAKIEELFNEFNTVMKSAEDTEQVSTISNNRLSLTAQRSPLVNGNGSFSVPTPPPSNLSKPTQSFSVQTPPRQSDGFDGFGAFGAATQPTKPAAKVADDFGFDAGFDSFGSAPAPIVQPPKPVSVAQPAVKSSPAPVADDFGFDASFDDFAPPKPTTAKIVPPPIPAAIKSPTVPQPVAVPKTNDGFEDFGSFGNNNDAFSQFQNENSTTTQANSGFDGWADDFGSGAAATKKPVAATKPSDDFGFDDFDFK